jgi:ATP-dependent exoDNAse (exonuclease V) beta subunit
VNDNEPDAPADANGIDNQTKDEVYLGTIHRAKGKEFKNVIYFNLSQTSAKSEKIGLEEERRVAYVGATRPKDSLLITFMSAKPSIFLSEISLNPKYKEIDDEELTHKYSSITRSLKKEELKLGQIEQHRNKLVVQFDQLTNRLASKKPSLLLRITWIVINWRINIIQAKLDSLDQRIKKQKESILAPLLVEISDLGEETNLRKAIMGSKFESLEEK